MPNAQPPFPHNQHPHGPKKPSASLCNGGSVPAMTDKCCSSSWFVQLGKDCGDVVDVLVQFWMQYERISASYIIHLRILALMNLDNPTIWSRFSFLPSLFLHDYNELDEVIMIIWNRVIKHHHQAVVPHPFSTAQGLLLQRQPRQKWKGWGTTYTDASDADAASGTEGGSCRLLWDSLWWWLLKSKMLQGS